MSYDIDTCKKVVFENVVIPYADFFTHQRQDWHPRDGAVISKGNGDIVIKLRVMESTITGIVDNAKQLHIIDADFGGEGSGTAWEWIWKPAIIAGTAKNGGKFSAVFIWEGGDSISRETIENGVHTSVEVEF